LSRGLDRSPARPWSARIALSCRTSPDSSDTSVERLVVDDDDDTAAGAATAPSATTHARTAKVLPPPDAI
jgi:hypothetical protein